MYTKGIFGTHLFLPIDELQTPIKKLKKKLTARPKYSELAHIPMFDESKEGYIGVPRYYNYGLASSVENLTVEMNRGRPFEHVFTSKLRDNQFPLYTEFAESVLDGKTGFILKARTGSGKTVILLKFIELIGRSTLVIVPTVSLLTQWQDMIVEHTKYQKSDIGHVQADIVDYKDKPITLGLVQSVCKDKYGEDFKNNFGVIAIDEIHRCGAYHFSKVVSMFSAMYRIGASGTLSRLDGMDTVFLNHMGEKIISLGSGREEENRPKILVVGYRGAKKNIPGWTAKLDKVRKRGVIISALAKDNKRNNMLASVTIKLSMSGRRVLVLSDRIKQLQYLLDRTNIEHKPGLFISTTTKKEKEDILKNSGIIYACVSSDTECLTLAGWKKYSKLNVGEQIASYDMKTDRICYEPLGKIAVYSYKGELCHIDRKASNILMTWNHRNVVVSSQGNILIRKADQLLTHDKILLTAPVDYPVNDGFSKIEWAELFGWVLSEGHYIKDDGVYYKSVGISQNKGRNADRIDWLLNVLGLKYTYRTEGRVGRWRISSKSSGVFFRIAPFKLLNSWLAGLPQDQLKALFGALIAGDGHTRLDDGRRSFIQKDEINLNWFSVIALRLEFSQKTSIKREDPNCGVIYLTKKRCSGLSDGKFKIKSVPYDGKVWCPVVLRTGTWIARRKGSVFITGNTFGMFSTGMDVPDLAGLVFATPQSRVRQAIGRISRLYKGKKRPVVIDTVDLDIEECVRWYYGRVSDYNHPDVKGTLIMT